MQQKRKRSITGVAEQRTDMDEVTKLQSAISCNICFEIYRDPRVLTCQHIFCLTCLNDYIRSQPEKNSLGNNQIKFACPNCRKDFEVDSRTLANNFQKAFFLNEIIEFYNKTYSKIEPSAPPAETDFPRQKTRRISHQLTKENYENISAIVQQNPNSCPNDILKIIVDSNTDNSNRFGSVVQEIKRNSQSPEATSNYEILRDQEELLDKMNKHKDYASLRDHVGSFHHLTKGQESGNDEMQFIETSDGKCSRIVISHDGKSSKIWLYADVLEISPYQEKKTNLNKTNLPCSQFVHEIFIKPPENLPFTVNYINHFRYGQLNQSLRVIYFTCNVKMTNNNDRMHGVVLCYKINEDLLFSSESSRILTYYSSSKVIIANDCEESLNKFEVLAGIDIDRKTNELFVASPRNFGIQRLHGYSLSPVDDEWSFQRSNLRPKFIAYCPETNKIWASCPEQDKLLIMNKTNNKYHESSPRTTLGIELSQMINTTDNKILGLDSSTGRVYWLKTLHNFLFSQVLEQGSYVKTEKVLSIKPIENFLPTKSDSNGSRILMTGGFTCTDTSFGYALFPARNLSKPKSLLGSLFQ